MKRSCSVPAFMFATALALFACGSKGPLPPPDKVPPTVSFTIPANGSSNIPINLSGIKITFSEAMDQSTINETTITLESSSVSGTVPGSVTITDLAGTTVDLIPSVGLIPTTLYRIVVGAGVKDKYGNTMSAPFTASFYTGTVADTTPPVITTSYPATGATGVPVNSSPRVTFSEPVITQTIVTSTAFVLTLGTTTIPGTVSYSGSTAVFTPTTILVANALYTARIAGGVDGVRDLAGNPMSADYTWTFSTAADTTPPQVTATTPAAGGSSVGVNAAISVTFSEPVDQASIAFGLRAGGIPVAGSLTYSGTTAIFTPQNVLAYGTQYTATVSAGLRDLAGNAMTADHGWTFTTGIAPDTTPPSVTATTPAAGGVNVDVNTAPRVTFSEAVDELTIAFTLIGGGVTVPCTMSYSDMTATFTLSSVLTYNTLYTAAVSAGVKDLAGNPMPNKYFWSFMTGTAPDTTPPSVLATSPGNGAISVLPNAAISVTFSEPVDQASIAFGLRAGGVPVAGSLNYSGTTAVFTPSNPLNYSTLYTGKVSAGVKDPAGNAMPGDYSWSFTTGTAPDTSPPNVTATTPAAGEVNVGVTAAISATFSEPVDQTTILFALSAGGIPAAGSLTYSGTTAIFTPSSPLNYSTLYTGKVSAGVKDLAGNAMTADQVWTFTTGIAPDTTPPGITATSPAAGSANVGINAALSFTFSEPVDQTTILFALSAGGSPAAGSLAYSGTTAVFTPSNPLNYSTLYTGKVSAGVKDLAGNAMPSDYSWSFTTGMAPDTTPPNVTATTPAAGEVNVGVNAAISATFSEPVDQASLLFTLTDGTTAIPCTTTYSGMTAIFTPLDPLNYSTFYTGTVSAGIKDLAGNAMPGDYSWSFTTGQ